MSDVEKNLDIKIQAKDEASAVFSSALDRIKAKSKELNQEARASGDTALERILKGGGILGIVTLAGEALKKFTGEAVKLSQEFAEGKINAADIALELGKSIPVIGGFVEAGESINELFTHQKEKIAHINEDIKAGNDAMEIRVRLQKEAIKAEEDLADRARKASEALRLAQAGGPGAKPGEKQDVEGANKLSDINAQKLKDQKEFENKRSEDAKKEIEDIRKAGEARKKVLQDDVLKNPQYYTADLQKEAQDHAGAQSDFATQKAIHAAEQRARDEVAAHKKGLDAIAADDRAAAVKQGANDRFKDQIEGVKSFFKAAGEAAEKALSPKDDKLLDDANAAIAKAKVEQLRITGHALEADLLQLKTAHEQRLKEIKDQAQKEIAANPLNAKKIRDEESKATSAENQSFGAATGEATAKAGTEQQEKHAEIQRALEQGRIELLEKEAALGDVAAGREAERLKIADEYKKKKEEILKLSQGASEADRAAIQKEVAQLDAQQRGATALADLNPLMDAAAKPTQYAGFEDFRKTGGIADAQRERDRTKSNETVKKLEELIKAAERISTKLDPLKDLAGANAGDGAFDTNLA